MKILLFGKNGQVGWELQRSLCVLGEMLAVDLDSKLPEGGGDFTKPDELVALIHRFQPDVIVNAAAYTAVDKAESEPELAHLINAEAPGRIALAAEEQKALLIHYSTDYVFDGSGDCPWQENSTTGPLNVYGITKLEGERQIQNNCSRYFIFRTSWVYAARGANFARTMLRQANEKKQLTVIDDQFGAPTGADLIADITAHSINKLCSRRHDPNELYGTYHLVAHGETNWHQYARFVIATALKIKPGLSLKVEEISPVPTSAFPTPAHRPKNSRLDTARLREAFALVLPDWQVGVERMLREIL